MGVQGMKLYENATTSGVGIAEEPERECEWSDKPEHKTSHLGVGDVIELRRTLLATRRRLMNAIMRLRNEMAGAADAGETGPSGDDHWEKVLTLSAIGDKLCLLHEVDQALSRMANKTYGYCVETDKPIALSRLREIPWARCG